MYKVIQLSSDYASYVTEHNFADFQQKNQQVMGVDHFFTHTHKHTHVHTHTHMNTQAHLQTGKNKNPYNTHYTCTLHTHTHTHTHTHCTQQDREKDILHFPVCHGGQ